MSLCLSATELAELTGKQRRDAQIRALRLMGISFSQRPDGTPAVLREHVEKLLGGELGSKPKRKTQPDFSAVM